MSSKRTATPPASPSSKRGKVSHDDASSSSSGAAAAAPEAGPKRCVLAYSGGLDTSVILVWLIEKGYQVVCFTADVGQVHDDLKQVEAKALKCGAEKVVVADLRKEFVDDFVFPFLRSGSMYEGRYLLGTSIARPVIAKALVDVAHQERCGFIAHGATGKGNDQVRFELTAAALDPSIVTIAPWRDPEFLSRFEGRQDLLRYAAEHNVKVDQTPKASYSIDENLFHTSYESGILEDPSKEPPAGMFKCTREIKDTPDAPANLRIDYRKGDPVRVTNLDDKTVVEDSLELVLYLNRVGGEHGVGRVDIVENRFVGIKSRGVYETPGGTILFRAHQDLESITLDRGVLRMRDMLAPQFAELTYNGFWYSPEMDFVRNAIDHAQQVVDGFVVLQLFKGNITIKGRGSDISLYSEKIASMDISGGYNPTDAQGFIRINALRLKAHQGQVLKLKAADKERFDSLRTTIPKP